MLAAPAFQQWKAEKHLWMKETIFQLERKLNVMVKWTYTNWATLALAEFLASFSWRVRIVPSNHISTICEFCSQNWRTWKTAGTYIHRHSLIFRLDLFPLHCRRWKGTSVLTLSALIFNAKKADCATLRMHGAVSMNVYHHPLLQCQEL